MKDIHHLRQKIDHIDDQIVELISKRFKITDKIGSLKADFNAPAVDEARESWIIARLREKSNLLSLNPELIDSIFRSILSEVVSKHQQINKHGRNAKE